MTKNEPQHENKKWKYPVHPFLPAILFALFPAFFLVQWFAFDPVPFERSPAAVFLALITPFVFIGLFGLMFRKIWALWLHLVLWIVCLLFNFYAYFVDARIEQTYFPRYFWLYEQNFYYFSACILSCWFGLWRCQRLKRSNIEQQ